MTDLYLVNVLVEVFELLGVDLAVEIVVYRVEEPTHLRR